MYDGIPSTVVAKLGRLIGLKDINGHLVLHYCMPLHTTALPDHFEVSFLVGQQTLLVFLNNEEIISQSRCRLVNSVNCAGLIHCTNYAVVYASF